MRVTRREALVSLGAAVAMPSRVIADEVAAFYSGKTIDLNIGFSAGGGFDLYARTVARHISRYIPGNPKIIPRQMPGAGSFRAAQFMFSVAPQDGTHIATFGQSIPLQQILGDPGIKFDTRKFNWIGNPVNGVSTIGVWAASGIRTIEDATRREVTVGATGHNVTMQYPLALNKVVGTKFKVILGYPGGNDIELAMERGEVDGKGQFSWASLKSAQQDWLRDKKVNLLVQVGLQKDPEISAYMGHDVPLMTDLAQNENDRRILELLSSGEVIGRPLVTTPNVPAERLQALRDAFDATMKDAEFLAEAKKLGLDVNPLGGARLQEVVEGIVNAPESVVEQLRTIMKS